MKYLVHFFLFALVLGLTTIHCYTSKNTPESQSQQNSMSKQAANTDASALVDLLRLQSGLVVTGSGDNVQIQIRGVNSLVLDTRPLYVVNGVPMGRDYGQVNDSLNPQDVSSIRILKSLSETSIYGEMGRNGVIMIKTKSSK